MKWPPVVESWMYRDPADIGDALVRRTGRQQPAPSARPAERDRYYTQARKVAISRAMKGRR